jgi:hypothetical protein
LEQRRWSGSELNDFEVGLALEIDLFFYKIKDLLPPGFSDEIWENNLI